MLDRSTMGEKWENVEAREYPCIAPCKHQIVEVIVHIINHQQSCEVMQNPSKD